MKTILLSALALAVTIAASPASARNITVEITNLTNAVYFTPLFVSSHSQDIDFFEVGEPASAALQAMAEGGDISGLITQAEADNAVVVANPAGGLLAPGATATAQLNVKNRHRLTIAAMLLPTNDGFMGLDSFAINKKRDQVIYLYGYDAGTEANDELLNTVDGGVPGTPGIPGDPSGLAGAFGTGVSTGDHNASVHIHRGVVGDGDPTGGSSDLDRSAHRWLSPVARVVITR